MLILAVAAACATAQSDRDARIAAHRQKIQDVLDANQMVNQATAGNAELRAFPPLGPTTSFDSTQVPLLKKAGASDEQTKTLRELNQQLWEMRNQPEAKSAEGQEMVRKLLEGRKSVLTEEQNREFSRLHRQHMQEIQSRHPAPATPETTGPQHFGSR